MPVDQASLPCRRTCCLMGWKGEKKGKMRSRVVRQAFGQRRRRRDEMFDVQAAALCLLLSLPYTHSHTPRTSHRANDGYRLSQRRSFAASCAQRSHWKSNAQERSSSRWSCPNVSAPINQTAPKLTRYYAHSLVSYLSSDGSTKSSEDSAEIVNLSATILASLANGEC